MRDVQISEGHPIGKRLGTTSGGAILLQAARLTALYQDLPFHLDHRATAAEIGPFETMGWGGPKVWSSFPNTDLYGPILYVPSAIALFVTRHLNWTVLASYYAARFTNAVVFLLLGAITLAIARRGRLLFCFFLTLPMAASLAASVSQDGMLIATSALLAAVLTNQRAFDSWSWLELGLLGIGFGILGMAKPPYLALAAIPCLLGPRRQFLPSLICPLIAAIMTFGWLKIGVAPARIHFAPSAGVSEDAQLAFVLHHPLAFIGIVNHTISVQGRILTEQFVGVMGWLDAPLPQYYYHLVPNTVDVLLAAGFAARLLAELYRRNYWFLVRASLVILLTLLCLLGIFFSLYVIWTDVGKSVVDGVQGRYLIPISFFLLVLMPDFQALDRPRIRAVIERSSALLAFIWMGLATFVFYQAILLRFWLP